MIEERVAILASSNTYMQITKKLYIQYLLMYRKPFYMCFWGVSSICTSLHTIYNIIIFQQHLEHKNHSLALYFKASGFSKQVH